MKDIENWLKNRYSEQLVHANSAFISSIIYDYCTEVLKNNAVLPLVSKRFEIEFKYVDRTDATLHKDIVEAEDSGQAISKLFQKYGYNIEWWTVKNVY
jgi:hypothetical protein